MPGGTGAGGRPKEVLRAACREQVLTRKGIEFVGGVMDGTETEDHVVTVGSGEDAETKVVQVRPKLRDRLLAFELLTDRGWGRPEQGIKVEDERPRPTSEQTIARILELLPRVLSVLPVDQMEIARLLQQRREVEFVMSGQQVKCRGQPAQTCPRVRSRSQPAAASGGESVRGGIVGDL